VKAHVAFEIDAPLSERDRLAAELHSWDTLGLLERDEGFTAYFADAGSAALVHGLADVRCGVSVRGPFPVPAQDWERSWREGLAPREVAGLWIRPSWCAPCAAPEIVIDPQQAFGSGEHASTRLALALLLRSLRPGDRVLDVGSGSGILALAALRCGARGALGIDFDADACRNARENAQRNGLPLWLARATPAALRRGAGDFQVAVANLLASELAGCLAELAALAQRELILSGYLRDEQERWRAPLGQAGWQRSEQLEELQSGDHWMASRWLQARARKSSSREASVDAKE
jgi:ribosomal protein L11 methyltransferase